MGALEGAWSLAHGKLTTLSEQNIIDCSGENEPMSIANHWLWQYAESQCIYLHTVSYGNHGCNGGNMYNAYQYVVANGGVDTQSSYPFQGRVRNIIDVPNQVSLTTNLLFPFNSQQSSCTYSKSNMGAQMSSFINIQSGVESSLQRAVAYVGPVSVAVDASNKAFRVSKERTCHVSMSVPCMYPICSFPCAWIGYF